MKLNKFKYLPIFQNLGVGICYHSTFGTSSKMCGSLVGGMDWPQSKIVSDGCQNGINSSTYKIGFMIPLWVNQNFTLELVILEKWNVQGINKQHARKPERRKGKTKKKKQKKTYCYLLNLFGGDLSLNSLPKPTFSYMQFLIPQ